MTRRALFFFLMFVVSLASLALASCDSPSAIGQTAPTATREKEVSRPPMPTPAPTSTPKPTNTPTPTATPEPKMQVDVVGYDIYRDANGRDAWVVGETQNNGEVPVTDIHIAISLIAADGKVVAVGEAYPEETRIMVPVGEKAPFSADIQNAPESWDKVKLQPQASPWDDFRAGYLYVDLKAQNETLTPPVGDGRGYIIVGEVVNTGQVKAKYARVVAAGYGADGKLIDVAVGDTTLEVLAPGETSPFGLEFHPNREIATYVLYVGSNRDTE